MSAHAVPCVQRRARGNMHRIAHRKALLAGAAFASLIMLQSGFADFMAQYSLDYATGARGAGNRFVALFTTAPASDAGTGGTEVSGGAYARVQIAGALSLSASFTTSSTTLTLASTAPAWLLALGTNGSGVNVYDATNSQQIGTVSSITSTTVTLQAAALHASSGSADSIAFSAFPLSSASSGSEPATAPANVTNGASIAFPQSTASWGTVTSWGIYDASTSGNLYFWDYLGSQKWSPFTCTSASPGVLTCTDQTFANANLAVVSAKYGGTLPTTGGSWSGVLTVAGVSGATFNLGVNTTGAGDGLVRQISEFAIGSANITASFAASQFTLMSA
jgi:hypothetical protein